MKDKLALTGEGLELLKRFCRVNGVSVPALNFAMDPWRFPGTCAYYRRDAITIHLKSCAHIGTTGASWSFPGYFIDRTPYGVLQHELGHHVDLLMGRNKGKYFSEFSIRMRAESGEPKLTNYCPNDAEWFAEMFRVFVTNPDLLQRLRPLTFDLINLWFEPAISDSWEQVLAEAPARNIARCKKLFSQ